MSTVFRFPKGTALSVGSPKQRYVSLEPFKKPGSSPPALTAKSFDKVAVSRGPVVGRVAVMVSVKGAFGEFSTSLHREKGYMLSHRPDDEAKWTQLTRPQAEKVGSALGKFLRASKLNQSELARFNKDYREELKPKPDSWYETPAGRLASLRSFHAMVEASANGGWREK